MLSSVASLPPKTPVSDSCVRPQPPPPDCQGSHDEDDADDTDDKYDDDNIPRENPHLGRQDISNLDHFK